MKKTIRVLIGSNGGLTGVYLAKHLKKQSNYTILGVDASELSVGKFFVAKQLILPSANNDSFIHSLIDLLNKERIDVYLPVHSKETKIIAENEEIIRAHTSTSFIVSPEETFELLDNKRIANISLRKAGIPVPALIESSGCQYPIFMKKEIGSGSSGAEVIPTKDLHIAYIGSGMKVSFFELIEGTEYTLDCLFDQEGKLLGFNQRKRVKTIGGAVSITQNDSTFDIEPWIKKLSNSFCFRGCVNFQYIVRDNTPYFIDVNLRYPSGGLPLTVESGLDIPNLLIKMLTGDRITSEDLKLKKESCTMYRYFEEVFE